MLVFELNILICLVEYVWLYRKSHESMLILKNYHLFCEIHLKKNFFHFYSENFLFRIFWRLGKSLTIGFFQWEKRFQISEGKIKAHQKVNFQKWWLFFFQDQNTNLACPLKRPTHLVSSKKNDVDFQRIALILEEVEIKENDYFQSIYFFFGCQIFKTVNPPVILTFYKI